MPKTAVEIGAKAPSFNLKNQNGETEKLSDFKGDWVVMYFYPKDDTSGCTKEACEFSSNMKQFEKLHAHVVGVSPDSTESHQKFARKNRLKIDLLSDPSHKTLETYHAWGTKSMYGKTFEGVVRSTVLIDPSGKIAYRWPKVKPEGHARQVQQKLAELQAS